MLLHIFIHFHSAQTLCCSKYRCRGYCIWNESQNQHPLCSLPLVRSQELWSLSLGQGSELPKVLFKVPNFLWKCSCEELRTLQACPWAEEERQADDATSQNAPQLAQNADQSRKQIWFCKTDSSYWSDPLICKLHLALSRTFHPALYCI